MRELIRQSNPDVVEEMKWIGTPAWSHDGINCRDESYKNVVKLTFAKIAFIKDPAKLFNFSLDGNVLRAIDIKIGEDIDAKAFKVFIRDAITRNSLRKASKNKMVKATVSKVATKSAVNTEAVVAKATSVASATVAAKSQTKTGSKTASRWSN